MAGPDLKIVKLHEEAMAHELVGSMRRAADSIEGETEEDDRTVAGVFIQVTEGGNVMLYGWGRCSDRFTVIGMLHAAIATQA